MKKVTFDREFLQMTLTKSVKFVPSKSIIPALDNIKVSITNNVASFISCDGNAQLLVKCDCKATEDFEFCINAKLFLKTISFLSDNNVVINLKTESKVEIKAGKSKSNITLDCAPQDFPMMSHDSLVNEINVNDFYLKKAFKSVSKFVDDYGNNISCINIREVDNDIIFTGRMQAQMIRMGIKPISINAWSSLNVYPETTDKVLSLLADRGEVTVGHCGGGESNKVVFFRSSEGVHNDFYVVATVPNAKYPDTETLVKSHMGETKILLNTVEMKSAVKRLQLYVDIAKTITMSIDGDILRLTAINTMYGNDCEEETTVLQKQGVSNLKKIFNVEFILQILNEIEENEFWLIYDEDTKKPVAFTVESSDKNVSYLFLTKELF